MRSSHAAQSARVRLSAAGLVVGLIAIGAVASRVVDSPAAPAAWGAAPEVMQTAPAANAPTALFYCGSGTVAAGAMPNSTETSMDASALISILNTTDQPRTAVVTVIPQPGMGDPAQKVLEIGPYGTVGVRYADIYVPPSTGAATFAASTVEVNGGGVAVRRTVSGRLGSSETACATESSPNWYFANGTTVKGATQVIALFNPFPEGAEVNLTFATEEGTDAPADFQRIRVPAKSIVPVDIGQSLRRREVVATSVEVVEGRLIADQLVMREDGARNGLWSAAGAPQLSTRWYSPNALIGSSITLAYWVYNPGDSDAELMVTPTVAGGAIEPYEVLIPAGNVVKVAFDDGRVPADVDLGVVFDVGNSQGVVVSRQLDSRRSGYSGSTESVAVPGASNTWAIPIGESSGNSQELIYVQNVTDAEIEAEVSLLLNGASEKLDGLTAKVPAGQTVTIRVNSAFSESITPLVVSTSGPSVVERRMLLTSQRGIITSVATPFAD